MDVKLIQTSKIKPYPKNPRVNTEAVAPVVASIREFGFRQPIVVDDDCVVIAGHTRLEAAKILGLKMVPVHVAKGLSREQVMAYRIADNKTAEYSEWDLEALRIELNDLKAHEYDVSLTGYTIRDLALLGDVKQDGKTDPDDVPDLPDEPDSKLGQIWQMGDHRLMCGDAMLEEDVATLMEGQKADMVLTDPPYGVNYQSNMRTQTEKFDVLENDDTILDIVPNIQKFSDGWLFIWTSWKVLNVWLKNTEAIGYPSNMIIWHKMGGGIGDLKKTFSSDYEVALVWHRGAELTGKRLGSVWTVGKDAASSYEHPTQKPVELFEMAMGSTTKDGGLVLDLFGGSGSTLIACEKTKRKCYMMELDPKYCDVIIKRWEDYTEKKAVLCE